MKGIDSDFAIIETLARVGARMADGAVKERAAWWRASICNK